jgi:hypothetical protein
VGGEKRFLAPSNFKHLQLSAAVKRMWLKQIKLIGGSKYTHRFIPSGSSFSFPVSSPPSSSSDPLVAQCQDVLVSFEHECGFIPD